MEVALIIVGYTFVAGAYVYTWKSIGRLWESIEKLHSNELHTIKERLNKLEGK